MNGSILENAYYLSHKKPNIFKRIWKWWKWRYAFRRIKMPIITRVFPEYCMQEFTAIQPLNGPSGQIFYLEYLDERNPVEGQTFEIGPKYKLSHPEWYTCSCLRNSDLYWHKLWNGEYWIYEQNLTELEWKFIVEKY